MTFRSFLGHFEVILKNGETSFFGLFFGGGVIFRSFLGHFWVILRSFLGHFFPPLDFSILLWGVVVASRWEGCGGGDGVRLQGNLSLAPPPPSTLPNKMATTTPQSKKSLSLCLSIFLTVFFCLSLSLSLPPSLPPSLTPSVLPSWSVLISLFFCSHIIYFFFDLSLYHFFFSLRKHDPPPPLTPPTHPPPLPCNHLSSRAPFLSMNHLFFFPFEYPFWRPVPLPSVEASIAVDEADRQSRPFIAFLLCVWLVLRAFVGHHRATISRLSPCSGLEQGSWEFQHSSGCEIRQDNGLTIADLCSRVSVAFSQMRGPLSGSHASLNGGSRAWRLGCGRMCVEAGGTRGWGQGEGGGEGIKEEGGTGQFWGTHISAPKHVILFFFVKTQNHRKHLNLFRTFEISKF